MPAAFRLREFRDHDYPATVAVQNQVFPDYPVTEEELRYSDRHRDPKCRFERFVAEAEAGPGVTAVGILSQNATSYHPRKFEVDVTVHTDHQGRGIGKALYDLLLSRMSAAAPLAVSTWAREGMQRPLRFLTDRGFTEARREWESRLDVGTFDPEPFEGVAQRVLNHGIRLLSLAELQKTDPDCWRKLYDVIWDVGVDVPRTDAEYCLPEFDRWVERHRNRPTLLPEGYFIAVDGDRYAGVSWVSSMPACYDLDTGLTGVRRDYRRRGLALALKLRVIDFARRNGYPTIRTWNDCTNRGMLAINERLGFVKQPAWIEFILTKPDAAARAEAAGARD